MLTKLVRLHTLRKRAEVTVLLFCFKHLTSTLSLAVYAARLHLRVSSLGCMQVTRHVFGGTAVLVLSKLPL